MELLFITIGVFILAYVGFVVLFPKLGDSGKSQRTQQALKDIFDNTSSAGEFADQSTNILRSEYAENDGPLAKLMDIPPFDSLHTLLLQAGYMHQSGVMMLGLIAATLLAPVVLLSQGMSPLIALIGGLVGPYFLLRRHCKNKIRKRNNTFISMFPDVLDMCVRSLRSGFPISAAMRMVAENMDPPVSTEFKQVVEEMEAGRSVIEALTRMSRRVNEPDVNFFIVVLKVQQETGGNLSEVISNLSRIIRQRKQLRMKIIALTSEGRTTAYILSSLPVLIFSALYFIQRDYLEPLWTTYNGKIILGIVISLIVGGHMIVNKMIKIEV